MASATSLGSRYWRAISSPSVTWRLMMTALMAGASAVVPVLALLVLAEVERVPALSDVVVVRARARQQRVGADGLRRVLHQRPDDDGVVVGARRLDDELLERRVVQVGQLQQLDVRGVAEHGLDERRERHHHHRHRQRGAHEGEQRRERACRR